MTEQDEKGLDDLIIGFADALRYAVQNGYRNMYDWANFAVSKATLTLHVDVPEHDRQYASQLYDQKLKYAETLKILIEAAKERDVAESAYNAELLIREKLVEEHKTRMNRHKALKLRPEGPQLIAAAKEKAGNPVTMTEEEREVYDNVFRISEVKRLLRNAENQMGIQLHLLKTKEELIESTRQQLAVPPHTENPQLAAEFSVINKYFLDRLRASVDRAMHIRRVVDEYSDGLASIHEVVQRARAAEVRATIDDIEMQSVEAAQVARETAQMAKRIADNQRMLQKYEDQLQEILEQQKEELILSVTEVEIHADVAVENNQDQETETEYEFE